MGIEGKKKGASKLAWNPMDTAPKDGTVIIVPHSDYSGVQAVRWGVYQENGENEAWFEADWSDVACVDDDCPGWLPCPQAGWKE